MQHTSTFQSNELNALKLIRDLVELLFLAYLDYEYGMYLLHCGHLLIYRCIFSGQKYWGWTSPQTHVQKLWFTFLDIRAKVICETKLENNVYFSFNSCKSIHLLPIKIKKINRFNYVIVTLIFIYCFKIFQGPVCVLLKTIQHLLLIMNIFSVLFNIRRKKVESIAVMVSIQ